MDANHLHPCTLVWIDSRTAVVARWVEGDASLTRLLSDVPTHRRSTGHVRHDPSVRHGGGGQPQTAGEPRRAEHLRRFIEDVAGLLPGDDLVILGPGTVHEHLAQHVREADEREHRDRAIASERAAHLTDHQLVARLRHLIGADPHRQTVGAYRWTELPERRAGATKGEPRRVLEKPPRPRDREIDARSDASEG